MLARIFANFHCAVRLSSYLPVCHACRWCSSYAPAFHDTTSQNIHSCIIQLFILSSSINLWCNLNMLLMSMSRRRYAVDADAKKTERLAVDLEKKRIWNFVHNTVTISYVCISNSSHSYFLIDVPFLNFIYSVLITHNWFEIPTMGKEATNFCPIERRTGKVRATVHSWRRENGLSKGETEKWKETKREMLDIHFLFVRQWVWEELSHRIQLKTNPYARKPINKLTKTFRERLKIISKFIYFHPIGDLCWSPN